MSTQATCRGIDQATKERHVDGEVGTNGFSFIAGVALEVKRPGSRNVNAPRSLLTCLEGARWQRTEDAQMGFQPRPDVLPMTADLAIELGEAVRFQYKRLS